MTLKKELNKEIINFYNLKGRKYPWRETKDPYKILIAEILLKRTGAWKAELVYNKFINKYSSITLLSKATNTHIYDMIKSLGLSSRSDSLIRIAREIKEKHKGIIPNNYEQLVEIKGIGKYTANAILCLAYNEKVPLVDESIRRLYYRVLGYSSDLPAYRDNQIWKIADIFLPDNHVVEYNLGLLDLGALICTYNNTICVLCPINNICNKNAK